MDKKEAQFIVRDTLQGAFDRDKFKLFVKNLLNTVDDTKAIKLQGNYIAESFRPYIKKYERLATFTDPANKKVDILIVYLKKETSLERARTLQRNFVARHLKQRDQKDAALVAFVSPDSDDWRFSLVKMDYTFEEGKSGKLKVKEEFTPARRWSFLVGSNENSHTAQSQLAPIVMEDKITLTLEQLENAFNIEKVTNEFFENYRNLYLRVYDVVVEAVKNDSLISADFETKGVEIADFAKKLLGQIVFLYFLQKKGWFGVSMGNNWGDGDKKFLRTLFEKRQQEKSSKSKNSDFFNYYVEPLFYEALAKERDDDYYSKFDCRIPFLNGGLFDPIRDYDWVNTYITLPDELFSNSNKTKQGDVGDGILDVFDRYNFTVKEDEPLEKEVAVDPEMLGKVFENLLEVKDRKSKGTYYTPREIVHYMCEQSLINYLVTELDGVVSKEDFEKFIEHGEDVVENEARVANHGKETDTYKHQLSEAIRKNAKLIDKKLADIKVCDPAIGSGAFPVGMMSEIVKARFSLNPYLCQGGQMVCENRTVYDFKFECIQNSLYGVDLDPGAVEIAKLRLWLSLVVDEEDIKQIKPLPNLDYKIMQGNSLVEDLIIGDSFIRFDLDDLIKVDRRTKKTKHLLERKVQAKLIIDKSENIFDELRKLHSLFFEENNKKQKLLLKEIIDEKENFFIAAKCEEEIKRLESVKNNTQNDKKIQQIDQQISTIHKTLNSFKKEISKPFFLWKLHFADVFQNNGGFDVLIGNPPYLKERDNKDVFSCVNNSSFGKKYHQGKMDYWYYFLHKAIDVVCDDGTISYITSRYWLNSQGAKKLIKRIKEELSFVSFVDIGKLKVFDNVAGQHMVAVYKKTNEVNDFIYKKLENDLGDINKRINTRNLNIKILQNKVIFQNDEILLNSDEFKNIKNTVMLGSVCDISQGVVEAPDKLSVKKINELDDSDFSPGQGVFVLTKKELDELKLNNDELICIKPYIDPNDVFRYGLNTINKKYLIYSDRENREKILKNNKYKRLKKHLDRFNRAITSSNKPYGLHRPRENKYFENNKIVFKTMFADNEFAYDKRNYYMGFSFSVIIARDPEFSLKYILAILNSKFALHWFYNKGKKRGVGVDIGVKKLRTFPIKKVSLQKQNPFVGLVDRILSITKDKDYLKNPTKQTKVGEYEKEIDQLVYNLYGLTQEEIKIIEDNSPK